MMKPIQMGPWLIPLLFWSGLSLAAEGSGPGTMGGAGTMECTGMMGMMGGFMIIPALFGLLLAAVLILAILALVKYLRHG